jgi:hypothetical protein
MPSTYTTNLGIEKVATGEQSGTWGTTTNVNFDLIDQAVNGVASITLASAGTSGSPNTIDISNGSASDGRNKFIEFTDGGDLGSTAYVQLTPNDAEKVVFIRNSLSGSQSLVLFQGTYNVSNDIEIASGKDVVVKFDGGGSSATVTNVFNDLLVTSLTGPITGDITGNVTGNLTGNVTGNVTGNLTGNVAGDVTGNLTGNVTSTGSSSFTSVAVTGGTINGTQIGATSASAGTFTGITVTGTATIATISASAGAIDGTNIGSTTPDAGTFTTLATTGDKVSVQTAKTPASAGASGTAGDIAWDTNYIYVCVATNTWKRALLSTW